MSETTTEPAQVLGWSFAVLAAFVWRPGAGLEICGQLIDEFAVLARFSQFDPLARELRGAARIGVVANL
ncbi:MAG: hypothetical protein ABJ360_07250 [Roseobacter sp.]